MTLKSLRWAPAVLITAAAAIAFAPDVSVDYDHNVDFARLHTYSWLGVRAGTSIWQDRITHAVDTELKSRGLERVENGADVSVAAMGQVTERDTLETFYDGFPGWGWHGWAGIGTATTTIVPNRVGNLTIDMFQGGSKKLIWRGIASEVISSKPDKNDKKLDEAVDKMLKHFPPPSKG
jgi:hypothetical protein